MALTLSIQVSFPNLDEARATTRILLAERRIACANLLEGVQSLYRWEQELCEEKEVLALYKTQEARREELIARIKELHSYECPMIISHEIEGDADYLGWVVSETNVED